MKKLVLLACGVLLATGALAADSTDSKPKSKKFSSNVATPVKMDEKTANDQFDALFSKMDADTDGVITKVEFDLFNKGKKKNKQFAIMDSNTDGSISKGEFKTFKNEQLAKQNKNKNKS